VKLQAIITSSKHPVATVASIVGVSTATIYNWIVRYRKYGIEGLKNKPRGYYPSNLSHEQREIVFKWLKDAISPDGEPIVWTIGNLQKSLKEVFDVSLSHTPVWKTIHKMGFSLRRARPRQGNQTLICKKDLKKIAIDRR